MQKYIVDKYTPKNIKDILGCESITDDPKQLDSFNTLKQIYGDNYYDWRYYNKPFFHRKLLSDLFKISKNDDLPHIIFYGASGVGKHTIINLFLEMVFDNSIYGQELVPYPVQSTTNEDDVLIKQSMHHIIIEPNNNNHDRYLVQDVIKQYVHVCPFRFSNESKTFKVVQINNLDNLTRNVQTSLRCTIENYSRTCRFIMSCNSLSKVIPPLRSRCVCIHVPSQENYELTDWLFRISMVEQIRIPYKKIMNIVDTSNGNLKDILWKLELYKQKKTINSTYQFLLTQLEKQFVKNYDIMQIRETVYAIFMLKQLSCVFVDIMNMILKTLTDTETAIKIVNATSKYEHRLSFTRRATIQLEAYVIAILHILFYKK